MRFICRTQRVPSYEGGGTRAMSCVCDGHRGMLLSNPRPSNCFGSVPDGEPENSLCYPSEKLLASFNKEFHVNCGRKYDDVFSSQTRHKRAVQVPRVVGVK